MSDPTPTLRHQAPRPVAAGLSRWARERAYDSPRLTWVARYFTVSAGVGGGAWLLGVGFAIADVDGFRAAAGHPVGWIVTAALIASWWWTGRLLHERRRLGGWLALGTLVAPLVDAVAGMGAGRPSTLVISALGALAVLGAWRDLE